MKKFLLLLLPVLLFVSCNTSTSKKIKARLKLHETGSRKFISAENITNKKTIKAEDGIALFFNTNEDTEYYSNALSLIPANKDDLIKMESLFSMPVMNFKFYEDYMLVYKGNEEYALVTANEKGKKFMKKYKNSKNIIPLIQLVFMRHNRFKPFRLQEKTDINQYVHKAYVPNL